MAGNEIKIIIGGDASKLTAATKEASEALGTFTGLTNQTSSSLRKVAAESSNTAAALKEIPAAAQDLIPEGSVLEARETVKRLKGEIESLTGTQLKSDAGRFLVGELQLAEQELKKLEVEAGLAKEKIEKIIPPKLPLGAIEEARAKIKALQSQILSLNTSQIKAGAGKEIAADLQIAEKELKTLEVQAGLSAQKIENPLTKGFGFIRQLAFILPGIGVAGILGAISDGLINAVSSLGLFTTQSKKAEENAKELATVIRSIGVVQGEAVASEQGTLAQVNALAAAVSDSNRPYAQRKRALEELKEINKSYFGDLKIEDAATGKLAGTVNEYTKALINSAIQKQFADEIGKIAKAAADSDDDIAKARTKLAQANEQEKQAQERLLKARSIASQEQANSQGINSRVVDSQTALAESQNKVKIAQQELNDANDKSTRLLEDQALLTNKLNDATAEGLKFKNLQTQSTNKEEDALKKRLEALEKIKAATKDATQLVGVQEAIFELQVKIAIRDQGKNQLSKSELDEAIQGFQHQLNDAFKNQAIELEAIPKVKFSQTVRADINFEEVQSKIAKATGLDKNIKIPTPFEIDLRLNGKAFADNAERIRQQIKGVTDALFNGILSGIEQGASQLGEAFGNILSGGGVANSLAKAAQGMLAIVGDVLQQVGKQIILTSSLVAALKRALEGLFGPGGEIAGLAVGAALIATGALLKTIKFDVPKLAQGGIATGPTLGIFGEAGKEAIIPLDKLPQLVGKLTSDNQSNVIINGSLRVDGTDLALMLERVGNRRRRLG